MAALRAELVAFEPERLEAEAAARLAEELAVLENACGAARVRAAARASEGRTHRERGFADVAEWMANATGSTTRMARQQLDVISALEHCPDTRDALCNGEVSLAQADEIVHTVAEVPD